MYFHRLLDLKKVLSRKSAFLLGPRSSGKTLLYETALRPTRIYDLLETKTFRKITANPELIFEECKKPHELIAIDEVQKIPFILNEVHRCIEKKKARFLLTGSSARKLKRSQANLLGGRATGLELFPLVSKEIPDFNLERYINHGGIPRHYLSSKQDLNGEFDDYTSLYLKEEIYDEAATRNLDLFARFLEVMAIHSGDEMVVENFGSDCGIKASTFRNYLELLKDTLVGFEVPGFTETKKRKATARSKYFLFDVGVANFLAGRKDIKLGSDPFGKAFEHFIAMELRAYLHYNHIRKDLSYWRSTSQHEVDFVVGKDLAIEVKATEHVHERHLKGLMALKEEKIVRSFCIVSRDNRIRELKGVTIYPWQDFLSQLWNGKLV